MNRQLSRFFIIGFLSTFINFLFYLLFFKFSSNILLSSSIGYSSGIINSYIFGKKWVFKSKKKFSIYSILKFLLVYLIGGIVMTLIINLLFNNGIEYRLAWCLGISYSILNNFLGSKYLVFEKINDHN
tara:strand:+ start:1732 stop:2115 length:384 start_codon:yes stop_codon:yes gene_type:complete